MNTTKLDYIVEPAEDLKRLDPRVLRSGWSNLVACLLNTINWYRLLKTGAVIGKAYNIETMMAEEISGDVRVYQAGEISSGEGTDNLFMPNKESEPVFPDHLQAL